MTFSTNDWLEDESPNCELIGDTSDDELEVGECLNGWARGAQLRVYIVRSGISYVPGYEKMCSKIIGYEDPLEEESEDECER